MIKFKIAGLGVTDKQFNTMPFGRQIEYARKIEEFKLSAKSTHVSQKRRTHAAAWREFVQLNDVKEYYTSFVDCANARDDVFEVWYKTA